MALGKHVMLFLCHLLLLLTLKADSICPKSYTCGNFSLEFPFTISDDPDCGLFLVYGCDSEKESPRIHTRATTFPYQILRKASTNSFYIRDYYFHEALKLSTCLPFRDLYLPSSPFVSFTFSTNLTFFTFYSQTPHDYFPGYRNLSCKYSTA